MMWFKFIGISVLAVLDNNSQRVVPSAVILFVAGITLMMHGINNEQDKYKSHLGDTIVIKKDTLIVIDYSTLQNSYTLSNGSSIAIDLINNKKWEHIYLHIFTQTRMKDFILKQNFL